MSEPLPRGWMLEADNLRGVPHGFFTRRGGTSQGRYASLNASLFLDDCPSNVIENRRRVAAKLKVNPHNLLGLKQIHSTHVVCITREADVWLSNQAPSADAMVSNLPGYALGILTADCAPILLASADAQVVGAAHAGWRGAIGGVVEATVCAMRRLTTRDIIAAVGPCISMHQYEIGVDLLQTMRAADRWVSHYGVATQKRERISFDLRGYVVSRLRRAGVRSISTIALDTYADRNRFFSHRRALAQAETTTGRQLAAICPKGST